MLTLHHETPASAADEPPSARKANSRESSAWRLAVRIVLLVTACVAGVWLVYTLRSVLILLLIATILATGLHPLVSQLERLHLPRMAAVLAIYLALLLGIVGFVAAIVPIGLSELDAFIRSIPSIADAAGKFLQGLVERIPSLRSLDAQTAELIRGLAGQIGALASQLVKVLEFVVNMLGSLFSILFILLMTFYLLVDGARVRAYLLSFVAPAQRAGLEALTDRIGDRMGRWLVGEMVICTTVGLMAFAGLSVIGIRGAILLGLIAGVGEFIPNIGPFLSAIPAVLIATTQSPLQVLLVVLLFILIHELDFLLLVPIVMKHAVRIHPLAVVLALLVGAELFGLVGALVAVPTATALSVVLDEIRTAPRSEVAATAATSSAQSDPDSGQGA